MGNSHRLKFSFNFVFICYSGNPKEEPGAIVCRVSQSFLRFGSYQIHAARGKEDLGIVRALADYTIRHHFPHIENMTQSEGLSFSIGEQDESIVDLTSNKYAGEYFEFRTLMAHVAWMISPVCIYYKQLQG